MGSVINRLKFWAYSALFCNPPEDGTMVLKHVGVLTLVINQSLFH